MANRHLESLAHRQDGSFLLASSALTGKIWNGTLWVFGSIEDYTKCPNLDMVATRTSTGITDTVWLPDEKTVLLSTDSGELEVWRCSSPGYCLESQLTMGSHDDMALCVGCLSGGHTAVSGGADRRVIIWDIDNEKRVQTYNGHTDMVVALGVHRTSESCFVTSSLDGTIKMWDLRLKDYPATQIPSVSSRGLVYTSIAWSTTEDHSLALGSESGLVEFVDLRSEAVTSSYQPHIRAVRKLAYSPYITDHTQCRMPSVLGRASASDDCTVAIYSLALDSKVMYNAEHRDYVRGLSWHPSAPHVLTCGWDGQVLQHSVTDTEGPVEVNGDKELPMT